MKISNKHQRKINAAQTNFIDAVDTVVRFDEGCETKNEEYELRAQLIHNFIKKLEALQIETLNKITHPVFDPSSAALLKVLNQSIPSHPSNVADTVLDLNHLPVNVQAPISDQ